MRDPSGREAARGDLLLLAGCIALALLALMVPRPWASAFSSALRQTVLRPVVLLQSRAVVDRTSRFRLAAIERDRDSLALMVLDGEALRRENENLRALLALRGRLPRSYRAANVLHRPIGTDSRMLLIDAGSAEGVTEFDPVVSGDGLIGSVWSVDAHSSTVLTWLHPDFRASAVTADGGILGTLILAPSPLGFPTHSILELSGVPLHDSLPLGTVVYTSGIGTVFPRGVPVGRISGIGAETQGWERVYQVAPFANPGDATAVMVLTLPHDSVFLPIPARGDSIR
jgi:rod shape-determining protein MreC